MGSSQYAFVFDLDGVIRHWDPAIVRDAEASNGLPEGALLGTAFEPALLLSAITGRISDALWREEVARRLRVEHPDADATGAVHEWSEPHGEVIAGAFEVLGQARARGTVSLLSNATDRLRSDLEALSLIDSFDHIFNSSEIGFAKPDSRVFAHVEHVLHADPREILFIDDSASNITAASSHGWDAILATPETDLSDLLAPYLH